MNSNPSPSHPDLATIVRSGGTAHRSRRLLITIASVCIAALAMAWIARQRAAARNATPRFVTEPVRRGDLHLTITATGNLEPTNEVTVGSELSGIVLEVYVDTNDRVKKDQPLAKLDTTKLQQQTASSRANVRSANANIATAEATLKETEATLARAQELNRLSAGKAPSKSDIDTASAAVDRARAGVLTSQAALAQAEAQVRVNESDLGKAVIKSPIDGIVLKRSIEPGQTVAASFTAPELFVIAENLEHMKLKVSTAEADIARVTQSQVAQFTVDAWPDRTYTARVVKVAYGSTVTSNVVTYETELEVSNGDLSLRPGMTATADIRVAESKGVLLVPAAALRFDPKAAATAGAAPGKKNFVQSIMPMPPRMSRRPAGGSGSGPDISQGNQIWILRDGTPQPLKVKVGLSDGRNTEVSGAGLTEGLAVILRANEVAP